MKSVKKESFLYIAILIPIVMTIVIGLSVFYHRVELHPQFNFLYAMLKNYDDYACIDRIKHDLFGTEIPKRYQKTTSHCENMSLFTYDFTTRTSKSITSTDAKKLAKAARLSNRSESPDGFYIREYCQPGSDIGWWWGLNFINNVCVAKGNYQNRLTISDPDNTYYFVFLGWVL